MATRWSDLSESSRRLIIGAAVGEAVLKTAVLIDIRRRPASQIRGSKRMWIIAAVLVNSAEVGPLSYFAFGRRRREAGRGISFVPRSRHGPFGGEEERVDPSRPVLRCW